MEIEVPLSSWSPVGDASGEVSQAGLLQFRDGFSNAWQLLRAEDGRFLHDWLRIRVVFRPTAACNTLFHINLFEGRLRVVCNIDRDGNVVDRGVSESINCVRLENGFIELTAVYYNVSRWIAFGSASASGSYAGTGEHQFDIASIEVAIDRPQQVAEDRLLNYIDVGARGGRTYETKLMRRQTRVVMFEPDAECAASLVEEAEKYPGTIIAPYALYSNNVRKTLHITVGEPCSSLLVPNQAFLSDFEISKSFKIKREVQVDCVRYDSLYQIGKVPNPDAIKIDVQGVEFEVLEGFGGLLSNCIGVQLETHVYPIYYQQKLLTDITCLLQQFDLMLVRLKPQMNFGSQLVEFDAWFLKRPGWFQEQPPSALEKLATLKRIWML